MREIYNKTEEDIKSYIEILKEWLRKQPHLPQTDDDLLEKLLMRNKFRLEKTKEKIDKYYTLKGINSDVFEKCDDNSKRTQLYLPMPKLTEKQERIVIYKLLNKDPSIFTLLESLKYCMATVTLLTLSDYSIGEHLIVDWEGFSFSHYKKFDPLYISKFMTLHQEAFSSRIINIHYLNSPSFIDALLALFKPIFKAKIFNRILIHKDLNSLHDVVEKKYLPRDYGGEEKSLKEIHEEWNKELEVQEELLQQHAKSISDEKKRIGKPPYDSQLFGTDGSFKKLNLD